MTRTIFSALGIKDYGPLIMSAAYVASYAQGNEAKVTLVGSKALHSILKKSYSFRDPNFLETQASCLSLLPLSLRLLIGSLVIPLVALITRSKIVYLDDSFSCIPFSNAETLVHNPISCFSFSTLNNACVSLSYFRYVVHYLYQLICISISRPKCHVQSEYIRQSFEQK